MFKISIRITLIIEGDDSGGGHNDSNGSYDDDDDDDVAVVCRCHCLRSIYMRSFRIQLKTFFCCFWGVEGNERRGRKGVTMREREKRPY